MRQLLLVITGLAILASFQFHPTEAGVLDCEDFSTIDEAYEFFYENGGPDYDPYELDMDGDGLVCEWGVGGVAAYEPEREVYVPEEKEIPSFADVQECELMGKEYNGGNSCSDGFDVGNLVGWAVVILIGLTILSLPLLAVIKFLEWKYPD